MTDAPAPPPSEDAGVAPAVAKAQRRRNRVVRIAAAVVALSAVLVLAAALGVAGLRYGVRTEYGRAQLIRALNGLRLGPVGRLRIEGLAGDPLGDFTVRRVAIVDAKGAWLEARGVAVSWRWRELLRRRFHARSISAASVTVLRQPVLEKTPPRPPEKPPVSVAIDRLALRLQTLPAFSVRPGLYDITAQADVERSGAATGRLDARSLLHAGDGVDAAFQLGGGRPTVVRADAVEAAGGALAGALGLPAAERLLLHARADGSMNGQGGLTLDTLSGALHPLRATASWSRDRASLDATAVLAASRLLAPYAAKLGPEARLTVAARHDRGDLYDLDAALAARFARLSLKGPLDWRVRRTAGLNVALAVDDLSRWAAQPSVGPLTTRGVLSGAPDAFSYKGAVEAQRIAQSGYALARVAGPLTLDYARKEWRVRAGLAGTGGRGQGLAQALLGAAPRADLDASLLADNRLLIRSLKLAGAGLKVDASGGQGLFGGLSFKGSAQLSNLAAAHAGAHGSVGAGWSAEQAKGAKAWSFTLDARAAAFASGVAEADRLLGAAPHLTAAASYGPAGLDLARAELTGAKANARAHGTLSPAQVAALDLDWRAEGPFAAGPVEIAGVAKGTGRVTGPLATPRADLKADFASIDFGKLALTPAHLDLSFLRTAGGGDGVVALTGPTKFGPASAKTAFRFTPGGIALQDLVADAGGVRAAGSVALRDGAPSTADLTVAAGPGALLSHGRLTGAVKLVDQPGGPVASLALDGQGLAAPEVNGTLHALHLKADGPLARLPFQLTADSADPIAWRFAGGGVFARTGPHTQLALQGEGRVRKADFRTLEPAVLRLNPGDTGARLRLQLAGGTVQLDGRQTRDGVSAQGSIANVGLAAFAEDFIGRLDSTWSLNGRGPHLAGTLTATLDGARSRDAPENLALAARVKGTLADQRLHVDADATNAQGLKSQLALDLPTTASAAPFKVAVDRARPLRGAFSADGELRPLWDLLLGGDQTLSGKLAARGQVAGTLAKPQASGHASLADGRFHDVGTGLNLQGLAVQADFDQSAVDVRQFSGADGRSGTISGQGRVSLATAGASTFALTLKHFQLLDSELGRATASGAVTVTRDVKGLARLSGKIGIDRADITAAAPTPTGVVPMDVIEINGPGETTGAPRKAAAPGATAVALDVAILAPRGIFVRGKGLDAELSLDAHVGGTTAAPALTGSARIVRGSYDFAGKRFDFDDSGEVRLGATPAAIRLNLTATRNDPTLTAVVKITGTAAKPEIVLTSTPTLPPDEVLSQVLFGRSAAQLSPAEAAQLASALASLAGGGGFDIIGGLRQFAGLDRLALGGDQTSGTTVSGGKYLTNNIYLELTGGGRQGPSAQVELRVRRNLSIVSGVATQGDTRLSVRFRRNFP